jgi:FAD/FMN-containing dehydrogenase
VTIDLGYLNDTRYDRHTGVARVQPGARWEHVYGVLEGEGVTVAGGRVGDVGVGGYLTGGKYIYIVCCVDRIQG